MADKQLQASGTQVMDPATGEIVYEFDKGWGRQWEGEKGSLAGLDLTFVDMVEGDDFGMGPTMVILFFGDGEPLTGEPWGQMFSQDSPIVGQVQRQINSGHMPFRAKIEQVPSQAHKGQTYWTLKKAEPKRVN